VLFASFFRLQLAVMNVFSGSYSVWQVAEQPSPLMALPSSHVSKGGSIEKSPH
jgi:hypothetical protein